MATQNRTEPQAADNKSAVEAAVDRATYNARIVAEFRANKGRVGGTWEETPLVVLHRVGAKSGAKRANPVAYMPDRGRYLIWAANGGAASNPNWYHNLIAHPDTSIEVGTETIDVVAEEAIGTERERLFALAADRYPQLIELERSSGRVIPMIVLAPRRKPSARPLSGTVSGSQAVGADDAAPGVTDPRTGASMTSQPRCDPEAGTSDAAVPPVVDRATFQAELDALRLREKAHTREGDAITAARRRLPMVEVDHTTTVIGPEGPVTLLDVFEGRRQLVAYYFMWYPGQPAAEQCEGCTLYTTQVGDLSYLHAHGVTYATLCQGPYEESTRYRDFMGWTMPWYSAPRESLETLLTGRRIGLFHLVCYLRDGDRVFETYWTTGRGVEAMGNTYTMLDLTIYGRQEAWEDSPAGWPKRWGRNTSEPNPYRTGGRPIAQWPRLEAGRSDDLGVT